MTVKDKLIVWIYNKGNEIEQEQETIERQCRYMPLDSLDHFELMNAKIRLQAWKEFLDELFKIVLNCR